MNSPTHMPNRFLPFAEHSLEIFVTTICGAITAMAGVLAEGSPSPSDEVRLMLMPAIGALFATLAMMCFSPANETRQSLAGRAIISVLFGAGGPVVVGFFSEYGKTLAQHPVALLLAGAALAFCIFPFSRPLAARLYSRSPDLADQVIDRIEDTIPGQRRDPKDSNNTLRTPRRRP